MNCCVNRVLTTVDRGFNFAGTLPVIAGKSGELRCYYGSAQMTIGIAMSFFGLHKRSGATRRDPSYSQWENVEYSGCELFRHGARNIAAGGLEMVLGSRILGIYTCNLLPLTLLFIELNRVEPFFPSHKYSLFKYF